MFQLSQGPHAELHLLWRRDRRHVVAHTARGVLQQAFGTPPAG